MTTFHKRINLALTYFLCMATSIVYGQDSYYLYIGTYTRKTSEGIYVYQFNATSGDLKLISIAKDIVNPSFLAISADQRFLFSLGGSKNDSVNSFSIDKSTRHLTLLNTQSLGGSFGACHLQADQTGSWLIVGNYGSGSVTVLPIQPNGMLGPVSQTIQHEGKSVDPDRQQKPFVHSINIAPNNRDVFVPDLGTDKIMSYMLDHKSGQLNSSPIPFATVTPGSGPRHFTFHPNGKFAYLINEMSATITAFNYEEGALQSFQTVKNLPEEYNGHQWAADIHISPDGKFLYASNRAHESLGIYKINAEIGSLTLVGHQQVQGKTPRNFAIDPSGNFLLVANQDSDNIVVFKRNHETGALTFTGKEITISQPVCLKFIP
jgi:6-phosphogluconolactonase